jgi:hypothetical protein
MAKKKSSSPLIPPLSIQQVDDLTGLERNLRSALRECFDVNGDLVHELKFNSYIHAYIINFFEFYITAYLPYAKQFPSWVPQFAVYSVEWVMNCLVGFNGLSEKEFMSYPEVLIRTLQDHTITLHFRYKSSANPLLKQLGEDIRGAFLRPEKTPTVARIDISRTEQVQLETPSPQDLFREYHAAFPTVKKLDICWAAKQTYREWKRWTAGTYISGNTPDRAFRNVLTSGKDARELRADPRPKGWQ